MKGLKNKRIIIGGGATGMGAALAARLVEEGARVVVGDINAPALQSTVGDLRAKGGDAHSVVFDLRDEGSIKNLVQQCIDLLGGIDGLAIPAADMSKATYDGDRNVVLGMDWDIWDRTIKINLYGHALLMHHAIPHMIARGGGPIVTVSSGSAYAGHVGDRPAYASSKAGLHALVRHVARLCGKDNIRCNCVAPGLVMTEGARAVINAEIDTATLRLNALPRHGVADDIASAMAFFLSDDSAWITGQVLSVNGGAIFRD